MSLYALYTPAEPDAETAQVYNSVADNSVPNYKESSNGLGDVFFVSAIMLAELGVVILNQSSKKQV